MGLIKNQYTQRTFIQLDKNTWTRFDEFSAVSGVSWRQRVVMIDDSIVRGQHHVELWSYWKKSELQSPRSTGSPALAYPCFYGIDTQTRKELIAANHTDEAAHENEPRLAVPSCHLYDIG